MRTDDGLHKQPADPSRLRIGIVTAMFHRAAGEALEQACRTTLEQAGVPTGQIISVTVPGSFELPLIAGQFLVRTDIDAVILLGVILKGATYHFEIIANEVGRGAMQLMLTHGKPVIFEVLAAYTQAQVVERTTGTTNKGQEAAVAALHALATLEELRHG